MISNPMELPQNIAAAARPFSFTASPSRTTELTEKSVFGELYQSAPVLVVDDDRAVRIDLRKTLEAWGCQVEEAENGKEALLILARNPHHLVLSDIDMPEMDGFELLSQVEKAFPEAGIIMVSSMSHENIIDEALSRGAIGYIQKPFRISELKSQVTYALRKMQFSTEAEKTTSGHPTLNTYDEAAREFARLFIMTSDLHHVETGTHIRRIGRLSRLMAELFGCPTDFCVKLGDAAVWHDIGKLAMPDAILKKPGPLTPEEFEVMKTHPVLGGQILAGAKDPLLKMAHTVALYHHERWDGTGYPEKLAGESCPLEARIVGVVDVYDALTERRVYKEPWPTEKVQNFFAEKSAGAFDPILVEILLKFYDQFEAVRLEETVLETN